MFKKLMRNKKAQQTAEYALLISLVVAAVIAMQTYAQRTIQGRIRDAAAFLTNATSAIGNTVQYEPYYLETDYDIDRDDAASEIQTIDPTTGAAVFRLEDNSKRIRRSTGFQSSDYDTTVAGIESGI
jgi:Flp pilus assembly pilin Flp